MFEFVLGLLASPFIAYLVYAYAFIGKGYLKDVVADNQKPFYQKVMSVLLAIVISIVPLLLVIPLLDNVPIIIGLLLGTFFIYLFSRKSSAAEQD